jgi:hypothetical protein
MNLIKGSTIKLELFDARDIINAEAHRARIEIMKRVVHIDG